MSPKAAHDTLAKLLTSNLPKKDNCKIESELLVQVRLLVHDAEG